MTNYSIDDSNGTLITAGIQGEFVARRTAQRLANERGQVVRLYESGADAEDEGSEPAEVIAPEGTLYRAIVRRNGHTETAQVFEDGRTAGYFADAYAALDAAREGCEAIGIDPRAVEVEEV